MSWRRRRCDRRGHDWFPGLSAREFIATSSICLRCDARQVVLPYGECLSGPPELPDRAREAWADGYTQACEDIRAAIRGVASDGS